MYMSLLRSTVRVDLNNLDSLQTIFFLHMASYFQIILSKNQLFLRNGFEKQQGLQMLERKLDMHAKGRIPE